MVTARILIVEDEILVAREIEQHLCEMQYEVVGIVINADLVLQQVAETLPDLVLVDINLQGEQDGIEIAGILHDRFQIPVIYVTAYTDPHTVERAKVTHPLGYVLKPFNAQDLRISIELALFRHQSVQHQSVRHQSTDRSSIAYPPSREPSQLETTPDLSGQVQAGLPPSKLQKILDYIQTHLNQELSLSRLSNEIGITPYYFARLFKQSTGTSVHQYVIQQRVERAKQLLHQSELSIAEVSIACGFANPSHLAMHFKRIVGVSPKKFRFF